MAIIYGSTGYVINESINANTNSNTKAGTNIQFSSKVPAQQLPVVLVHGILSSAKKIQHVADWIHNNTGAKVYNIEIGDGVRDSISLYMTLQRDILCLAIYNITALRGGFNMIGISQGGLLARGYVEHCNGYKVNNLITWVSPHGGVYYDDINLPNVYSRDSQYETSFSNYWRDPYNYFTYLKNSSYLSRLNNENMQPSRKKEAENYKTNMLKLANFVMIWSPQDDVLGPPESAKFSMYAPIKSATETLDETPKLLNMRETYIYKTDALGLKTLDKSGRIHIYETDCDHADHTTPDCLEAWSHYTLPYLV